MSRPARTPLSSLVARVVVGLALAALVCGCGGNDSSSGASAPSSSGSETASATVSPSESASESTGASASADVTVLPPTSAGFTFPTGNLCRFLTVGDLASHDKAFSSAVGPGVFRVSGAAAVCAYGDRAELSFVADAGTYAFAKTQAGTPVPGVGDEAFYSAEQRRVTVKVGTVRFYLQLSGWKVDDAVMQKPVLVAVARQVAGRLT